MIDRLTAVTGHTPSIKYVTDVPVVGFRRVLVPTPWAFSSRVRSVQNVKRLGISNDGDKRRSFRL